MTRHRGPARRATVGAAGLAMLALGSGGWVLVDLGAAPPPSAVEPAASTPVATPVAAPAPTGGPGPRSTTAPATPMSSSEPSRVLVPAIGVDVDVMDLGLTDAGTLETPAGAFPAGWYTGSPSPGELGPAVLAGHVSWNGAPGAFADLAAVERGDEVVVIREDDTSATFVVTRTADYDKSAFPTDAVYGDIDHAGLRLVTCGGLDPDSGAYEENVVVFAELVVADPGIE